MPDDAERTAPEWGHRALGPTRYSLLVVCIAAQAATVAITWPLWQVRTSPPNLPALDLPQLPFGWLIVGSLIVMLIRPRVGLRLHIGVLLLSLVFDQFRLQPQVIGIVVMMLGVVEARAADAARWFLIAMWLWSGLHKLLSPDWLGWVSWNVLGAIATDPSAWHGAFAYCVAFGEMALGTLAIVRPRAAAFGCLVLHAGIALVLSPWVLAWNSSVIPWNLCTAVVGPWLMWTSSPPIPRTAAGWAVAAALLISPASFYFDWVPHSLAHALYSHNVPCGLITGRDGLTPIEGWGKVQVPIPHTRRLLRHYFDRTAEAGAKLHVADPRRWLPDGYFLKLPDGSTVEVDPDRFLQSTAGEVAGIKQDDPRAVFALSQADARLLKRTDDAMIYAVEILPERYRPELLDRLARLPNVEQLQLAGCRVVDDDLRRLAACESLTGIGLDDTAVTDDGVRFLSKLPKLRHFELQNTNTSDALRELLGSD